MREVDVALPPHIDHKAATGCVDAAIADRGLSVSLRDSLKKYPGCTHWHLKRERQPGTLEVTLWPQQRRAWFTVRKGRASLWIEGELPYLKAVLEKRLQQAR